MAKPKRRQSSVTNDSLLKNLNGECELCVYSEWNSKQRTVQVAEAGSCLVKRLGEYYRTSTHERVLRIDELRYDGGEKENALRIGGGRHIAVPKHLVTALGGEFSLSIPSSDDLARHSWMPSQIR